MCIGRFDGWLGPREHGFALQKRHGHLRNQSLNFSYSAWLAQQITYFVSLSSTLFDWFMMCQKEIWVLSNMNARGRTQARKCKADRHLPGLTPKSAKQHFLASFNDNFLCIIGASAHGALCVFLIFREVWWSLCLTKATTEMKKSSNCTIQTQSVL